MVKRKATSMKPMRLFKKSKPNVATKAYVRKAILKDKQVKRFSTALNEQNLSTISQGSFVDPIAITQGDRIDNREGDTVYIRGIGIRGVLHNNASTVNVVRMCCVLTREDADFSAATDLFDSPTDAADFSTVAGLNAIYHQFDSAKVTTKWDEVVTLGTVSDSTGNQVKEFKHYIKFPGRGLKVRYLGTGTGAVQVFPRVHLGFWAAEGPDDTSTGTDVELSFRSLTYFTD